ncbi:MAG: DUF1868 domain-containing protein [Gammaproteobacteria bacterium]|nr:DUF1868 domain-containing protein [Gammaproteobacteria bacterium]
MSLEKINDQGLYTPFPGVTVVAKTRDEDDVTWQRVHAALFAIEALKPYYALTPFESYHMTAINLYTERGCAGEDDWHALIANNLPFFQKIHGACLTLQETLTVEIARIDVTETIRMVLRLSPAQQDMITALATSVDEGLLEGLPGLFHITLGHNYRWIADRAVRKTLSDQVNEALKLLMGTTITLKPPRLTYFKDMQAFTPWEAKSDPFVSVSVGALGFLSRATPPPQDKIKNSAPGPRNT